MLRTRIYGNETKIVVSIQNYPSRLSFDITIPKVSTNNNHQKQAKKM